MSSKVTWTGWILAVTATAMMGALSRVPYETEREASAAVRLAWRVRGARVEECRTPTAEELAPIPAHMRPEEICEGRIIPHRLRVVLDGSVVVDEIIRASGTRQDRPLYVYQDLPVGVGSHDVEITFVREGEGAGQADSAAVPARLEYTARLELAAKEVALIVYDRDRRELKHSGYGLPGGPR